MTALQISTTSRFETLPRGGFEMYTGKSGRARIDACVPLRIGVEIMRTIMAAKARCKVNLCTSDEFMMLLDAVVPPDVATQILQKVSAARLV